MKQKIKQILNTITPQDLEEGCSRQVEEIDKIINNKTMIKKIEIQDTAREVIKKGNFPSLSTELELADKINEIIDYLNEREPKEKQDPLKIVIECKTIEEWRKVLDKLFGQGKYWGWTRGDRSYKEENFALGNTCINPAVNIACGNPATYALMGFKLIPASEYLGEEMKFMTVKDGVRYINNYRTNNTEEIINRWIGILRSKASDYEHKARGKGEIVSSPSLDDICNEMGAFIGGYKAQNNPPKQL